MCVSGRHVLFYYPLVNRQNYGTSPFLMGKSTISMAIFNSYMYVYQRVPISDILSARWARDVYRRIAAADRLVYRWKYSVCVEHPMNER